MKFILFYIIAFSLITSSCAETEPKTIVKNQETKILKYAIHYQDIKADTSILNEHFRGLFVSNNIAYIAGSNGSILKYNFAEETLLVETLNYPYHFRDIHFLKDTLYLMSIQKPSALLVKKEDGSIVNFEEKDTLAFFDGFDFWENGQGILFGDPINDYPYIMKMSTSGIWERVPSENIPNCINQEAGFAASGTSIVCVGEGMAYIGWGGEAVRVFKSTDYGNTWQSQSTPMPTNQMGTGIYSMAFKNEKNGVAVGGNWENPDSDSSKIYTNDGGKTWHLSDGVQGYRSCVSFVKDDIYISTGTNGTDISMDGGKTWEILDTIGFNAIQFFNANSDEIIGLGVGNYGKITKVQLKQK